MTEAQARARWCPLSRVEGDKFDPTAGNRDREGPHTAARCVGPSCMLWSWHRLNFLRKEPSGHCGLTA
jgi:hypothetical protein